MPTMRTWAALAAVLLAGLALRWPVAAIPLERDEGGYAYIAQRWLQGEVPYQSAFDQKPPGIYAAYAVIERALGESPAAIHWGTQLYTLFTLAAVFLIGRKLFGEGGAFAAGLLAAFLTADRCLLGNAANTETFMLLPVAGGFLAALLARERDSWRWAAACGGACGLALLFKQVALTDALFYLVLLALHRRRWVFLAAFTAAAAAVWLPVLLYFAGVGAWRPFYDCVMGYNLGYASGVPLVVYPINFWRTFSRTLLPFWPVYLLALLGALKAAEPRVRLVLAWLACSFLGACAGGFFRQHYFLQAVPALAVLAGHGALELTRRLGWARRPVQAAAAAALLAALWVLLSGWWYYGPGSAVDKCRRIYGANPFPESAAVARFIAERSTDQDSVFVFGSEPQIFYLSRRRSATRYIYVYPLLRPFPDTGARQAEALEEVRRAGPKLVVTVFVSASFLASVQAPLGIFDSVKGLLRGYRLAAVVPAERGRPPRLVTGEEAQLMWQAAPMWYDRKIWGSLAVWERRP